MKLYPFAIASAAVLGTAAMLVGSGTAATETGTTTAQQLLINQRISQAAVKRSNQSLNYLAPIRTTTSDAANTGANGVTPLSRVTGAGQGWTTAQIANQAITTAKIANGAVTPAQMANPGYFAVITAAGAVSRASTGATATLTTAPSTYTVTFPNSVSACGYAASPGEATAGATPVAGEVNVQPGTQAGQVVVTTYSSAGTATAAPFHLTVQC